MQSSSLAAKLAPFSHLIDPTALAVAYKALLLTPTHVRGCAMFGVMEMEVATGVKSDILIDGATFLQLLRSLPAAEFEITNSKNALYWKCGSAKGQLAQLSSDMSSVHDDPIEFPEDLAKAEVDAGFGKSLDLGALACGSSAMMSIGLYGVSVVNDDSALRVYSSDNSMIASSRLGNAIPGAPRMTTMSPRAARLLSSLTTRDKVLVGIDEQTVYCQTADTKLVVKQIQPLKFAIADMVENFRGEDIKVPLRRDVVTSFIRRAEALTEEKRRTDVSVSVIDGAVRLSFSEGKSSSEEYYLAENNSSVSADPIMVDSRRLSRALGAAGHVVFDHITRGALVLRGANDFVFVINGQAISQSENLVSQVESKVDEPTVVAIPPRRIALRK